MILPTSGTLLMSNKNSFNTVMSRSVRDIIRSVLFFCNIPLRMKRKALTPQTIGRPTFIESSIPK